MLGNYKQKIKILNDLKLSNEEFDFLYMIQLYKNDRLLSDSEFNKDFELYYEINKIKYNYFKFIKKYEELGYIINLNVSEDVINFNNISITDVFRSIFILDVEVMWKQVCKTYPKFMIINDRPAPLQALSNPNIKDYYFKEVTGGGDKFLHEQFISLTEYFYNGESKTTYRSDAMKLEKWIYSWSSSIKDMILEDISGGTKNQLSIDYDF